MTNKNDYYEQEFAKLLKEYHGFFAFSKDQFNESKKDGIKYMSRPMGLFHQAGKAQEFDKKHDIIIEKSIKHDLKYNSKEKIILKELKNYEAFYNGNTLHVFNMLHGYGFTLEDVNEVYQKHKNNY